MGRDIKTCMKNYTGSTMMASYMGHDVVCDDFNKHFTDLINMSV